ncbi:MAG: cysteine desulfurase NifS [Bacillota bacterium]|jgi:cysteine desulfurase
MRRVYLDHAATTPVRPEVFEAMVPYLTERFGNPSSIHSFGREARMELDKARERVAALIGAEPQEIVFTGGGSEADNHAIRGAALAAFGKKNHIITSAVEHHAVLDTALSLRSLGFEVTVVPVDQYGMVNPDDVRAAITPNTFLITIMHSNNEVGTLQPIKEIAAIAREAGVLMHTDAVQSVGHVPVDVRDLGVDMLSMAAHKLYGPKGVGALYIRKGIRIAPLITGGAQERKRRAGTENTAGIVGMGVAAELAMTELHQEAAREAALRDRLVNGLMTHIPHVKLNGHPTMRLPNNANVSFLYVEGEALLLNLDMAGIAASSGSACTSGSLEPSHVLLAMGIPHEVAHGSVRMTLGRGTTVEDVDYVVSVLPGIVQKLRMMSPVYDRAGECAIKDLCANPEGCHRAGAGSGVQSGPYSCK